MSNTKKFPFLTALGTQVGLGQLYAYMPIQLVRLEVARGAEAFAAHATGVRPRPGVSTLVRC